MNILGKKVSYTFTYDPTLLFSVPRSNSRDLLGITAPLPFFGADIWNSFEVNFLNARGRPTAAILTCVVPATSPALIESKSLKLYLHSLSNSRMTYQEASQVIQRDLTAAVGEKVDVTLYAARDWERQFPVNVAPGACLDDLDIMCTHGHVNASLLRTTAHSGTEALHSHLFRSNCPVTGQPDFATLILNYTGALFEHASLLQYIVSFRNHAGFHEACAEQIFCDLMKHGQLDALTVTLRFTRRGGIDINPIRSTHAITLENFRLCRQ